MLDGYRSMKVQVSSLRFQHEKHADESEETPVPLCVPTGSLILKAEWVKGGGSG